jgi:fermentation-respiration switch protein FrsA (DUF1100 family)
MGTQNRNGEITKRRNKMKKLFLFLFAPVLSALVITGNTYAQGQSSPTESWFGVQTFETTAIPLELEHGVHVRKVHFPNRNITVAGNLFTPANFNTVEKYPAIIVTHPNGGVKEQTAGLYAQRLAEKGFITLAYDASCQGESGGEPRFTEDPFRRVEDIRCAADFMANLPFVKSIGALGICAGGGFTIHAAQTEARFKAVATVSAIDTGRARREGVGGMAPDSRALDERRIRSLEEFGKQRNIEAVGGGPRYMGYVPNSLEEMPEGASGMLVEGYEYYLTPRGAHPRAQNRFLFINQDAIFSYTAFDHVDWISPHPLLLIGGSKAETLYFSRDAYNMAKEPRELFIIDGASHVDLYDKKQYVPIAVDKLADFFGKNL